MRIIIFLLTFILISSTVYAGNWNFCSWPTEDKALEVFYQGLNMADLYTTDELLDKGYRELNPLLGDHPSDDKLIIYMGLNAVLHYVVTGYFMDKDPQWKHWWQGLTIGAKGAAVFWNIRVWND